MDVIPQLFWVRGQGEPSMEVHRLRVRGQEEPFMDVLP